MHAQDTLGSLAQVNGGRGGLETGDVLGDFRVLTRLGQGGMGVVYLARDERLDRRVALKVIAPHLASDPDFRERFVTEARSAAAIDHSNVVPVYSSGVADDALYIAMRYVEGTDLRSLLRGSGPLDPASAAAVVSDIAAALDAAHAAGMVHRDVKPANILLEGKPGEGRSYLTDFGLTKGRSDSGTQLTGTGQWVGTIDYVAPEQIQAGRVDARTDVYALGCVLYEALTGSVPYAGSDMQKMWGHVNEPFPVLGASPGRSDDALTAIVARATAKDPGERYPSAGDLARAVAAAVTGGEVTVSEHSVATGSAAEGIAQKPTADPRLVAPGLAPTATGRAPAHRPEQVTRRMPSPRQPQPRRDPTGGSLRTAGIIGGSVILAAGLIAAAVVLAGGGSSSPRTAAKPGPARSRKPRSPAPGEVSTSAQPTVPPDATTCSATVSVGTVTSCPFGINVAEAYERSGGSTVTAYSPVTERVYTMHCGGSPTVLCTGGKNAKVYIASTEAAEPSLGDWPGGSGYSAMLGAFSSEAGARLRQEEVSERGLEAGVLSSSEFASLRPGYWIVFSGDFGSEGEAAARAKEARGVGVSDAYPRFVSP